jgi:uncharacterized protein (DUF58 family)
MRQLFPPEFLASIEALRIEARRVPPRGRQAEHQARDPGSGIEFRDYRAYAPGDDPRRVDWNLYARSRKLFMRLSDEVRELPLHVFLDMSDSLWFGDGAAADTARRAAALIAAVGLNQLDRVDLQSFGAQGGPALPALGGKDALPRVLLHLDRLGPLGGTDLAGNLDRLARLPLRKGLAVLISDFFDPRGLDPLEPVLRRLPHRLLMVRVVRPDDRDPALDGELRLEDCETHERVDVAAGREVHARYRALYAAFEDDVRSLAMRLGAHLVELDVSRPVVGQFAALFPEGVFRP